MWTAPVTNLFVRVSDHCYIELQSQSDAMPISLAGIAGAAIAPGEFFHFSVSPKRAGDSPDAPLTHFGAIEGSRAQWVGKVLRERWPERGFTPQARVSAMGRNRRMVENGLSIY
jgi:hypothetical protein